MTACLTGNTDGVSKKKKGQEVEFTSVVLRRFYVRNYGNTTVNYTDRMERQDRMDYRRSALLKCVPFVPVHTPKVEFDIRSFMTKNKNKTKIRDGLFVCR